MKEALREGLTYEFRYTVPADKTVPYLYPEASELGSMPKVFATGFLVGLIEWTCIQAINPHLDTPKEQSVGIGVNLTHTAATPAGFTITVKIKLEKMEGRKLTFSVAANDGVDEISTGVHERYIINAESFNKKVAQKADAHTGAQTNK